MHWYLDVWKKYAVFSGRAGRSEFWYFALFNAIVLIILGLIGGVFTPSQSRLTFSLLTVPYYIYALASLLPSLGVTVRRLHDTGKSGWMIFLGLIPLIGAIILLVFYILDSEPSANKYGPNPKVGVGA